MHNKLIFAAIFTFTASQMVAETIAVSALSPKEQIHHRLVWCSTANIEFGFSGGNDAIDTYNGINTAEKLLRRTYNLPRMNHATPEYRNSVERKINDDFDAAILLG